jgi:tripartite-type tricarboxylate transporter receptor subunit TctC
MRLIIAILITFMSLAANARTNKVIIPFPAGGGVDILFRNIEKFGQTKGITLIPEYIPGAEGIIGMNKAAESSKDILILTTTEVLASKDNPSKKFNSLTSFEYITGLRSSIFYIAGNTNKVWTFGYNSPMQKEILQDYIKLNKIENTILVPYKSTSQIINDILNETVKAAALPAVLLKSQISNGKINLIKVVQGTSEFAVVMPAGSDTSFWNTFFAEYLNSEQARQDADRDMMILKTFSKERIVNLVSKNLKD